MQKNEILHKKYELHSYDDYVHHVKGRQE